MRRQMRRKTEKVSGSEKMDIFFGRDLRPEGVELRLCILYLFVSQINWTFK